jgi:transcriptional regulator with XRE-family HTH domain
MIGERIKQSRIAAGLSMRELADRTGNYISAQVIHKYETGKSVPGSDVLIQLSQALGVKVEYFFRPDSVHVSLSAPAYRKRAALPQKALQSIQTRVAAQVERYLEMESLFPADRFAPVVLPDAELRSIRSSKDVESLAESLRNLWQLGIDPIENLTEVLEDRGLKIILLSAEERFDGLSCWANETIPIIVAKTDLSGDRHRSNLAHELGHLMIEAAHGIDEEKAAKRFCGAFLAPAEAVYRELGRKRNTLDFAELKMLKKKYGMSMQQWIYRAKDLGIITESRAAGWFHLFRARNWHKCEPGAAVADERPVRFGMLALQAVAEGLISPARAAEFLGVPFDQFRKTLMDNLEETHP